jgi:hypothetical protein
MTRALLEKIDVATVQPRIVFGLVSVEMMGHEGLPLAMAPALPVEFCGSKPAAAR